MLLFKPILFKFIPFKTLKLNSSFLFKIMKNVLIFMLIKMSLIEMSYKVLNFKSKNDLLKLSLSKHFKKLHFLITQKKNQFLKINMITN